MLNVSAENSSLNQILREIARLTGMKITGGVQDDRVFGTYGPAPTSDVIAKLLEGTLSNFMIVDNDQNGPAELILTARRGGVTPPNPNAVAENDGEVPSPPQEVPNAGTVQGRPQVGGGGASPGGLPPSNGGQTGSPADGGANLGTVPGAFAGYGQTPQDLTAQPRTGTGPDANTSSQPGGVSTPQQIYEQLQRLRQQQQTTASPQ